MPNKINMEMLGKELDTGAWNYRKHRTGESNLSVSIQMINKVADISKFTEEEYILYNMKRWARAKL